jgi:exosome complex component RRP42
VAQNVRIDGRGRFDYRPYHLETGLISQTNGSAKLVIGKTHVLVGVKASLGEPLATLPEGGIVKVSVECCPSASPEFEGKGAEDLNVKLAVALEQLILSSDHVDLKSLCLIPKRQCWILYIDAMVLDSGGNLFDAISIATRAALATTTLPKVKVVESGKTGEYELELSDDPDDCVSISVEKVPIFVTFMTVGDFPVVDPCMEEEMCRGCRVSMGINKQGNICSTDKGTGSLSLQTIPQLTLAATNVGSKIIAEIDAFLEQERQGKTEKKGFFSKSLLLSR